MKQIIRFLINSNIWVAICALGLAASSEIIFKTYNCKINQFVFFATIFIYNFQRIITIKNGNNHARKIWFKSNISTVYLLMLFSMVISGFYFFYFQLTTQIVILLTALLSFLYPFGIRKIPFAKVFVISFVWAISTMILLLLENKIVISQHIIWTVVSRFLFVFAITIPFDIRDVQYDSGNLITIPVFFGHEKAKWASIFSLLLCLLITIVQQMQNEIKLSDFLALMLLYFLAIFLVKRTNKNKSDIYFSFWVESLSVFSYLFLGILLLIF